MYDSFVSRATTPDLRFQLYHAVRLIDAEAGTLAYTPEGKLYNEPALPTMAEADAFLKDIVFPIEDGAIDLGCLIRRAEKEMEYLQLTPSSNGQYMKAWRELYCSLYVSGDTIFTRKAVTGFVSEAIHQNKCGNPNWEPYESIPQNLGDAFLVCVFMPGERTKSGHCVSLSL